MKYTEEELKIIRDEDYDAIGDQLSIDNWIGGLLISGFFIFLIGCMFFIGKCLGIIFEWIF